MLDSIKNSLCITSIPSKDDYNSAELAVNDCHSVNITAC